MSGPRYTLLTQDADLEFRHRLADWDIWFYPLNGALIAYSADKSPAVVTWPADRKEDNRPRVWTYALNHPTLDLFFAMAALAGHRISERMVEHQRR